MCYTDNVLLGRRDAHALCTRYHEVALYDGVFWFYFVVNESSFLSSFRIIDDEEDEEEPCVVVMALYSVSLIFAHYRQNPNNFDDRE